MNWFIFAWTNNLPQRKQLNFTKHVQTCANIYSKFANIYLYPENRLLIFSSTTFSTVQFRLLIVHCYSSNTKKKNWLNLVFPAINTIRILTTYIQFHSKLILMVKCDHLPTFRFQYTHIWFLCGFNFFWKSGCELYYFKFFLFDLLQLEVLKPNYNRTFLKMTI